MKILYLIPARAGSKGLPGKNTRLLNGKALVEYSIDFALENATVQDEICISSNDEDVILISEKAGLRVPFKRPDELSSDSASSYKVILHALNFYRNIGKTFDAVLLLQPTSPFREKEDFKKLIAEFSDNCDMVVTVKEAKENPYFTLFEEDKQGLLVKSKAGNFQRRQDCPPVYAYNGSMYLMSTKSLAESEIQGFNKIRKVVMPEKRSIDIDTMADWVLAEYFLTTND